MATFKQTAVLHVVLSLSTSVIGIVALALGIMKAAGIGSITFSWGAIGLLAVITVLGAALTAYNMFKVIE